MRIREQMERLWTKKSTKYAMAGTLCLVMAGALLTLNTGSRASAANVQLGSQTINLELESGAYQITTAEQLIALGSADNGQTGGKKFVLANDIAIDRITDVAAGSFAGELDGQGHVITVAEVDIPESTEPGEVSQGILFGTITGDVKNLIIDISGDVSYTRTSKVGRTDTEKQTTVAVNGAEAEAPYDGNAFSVYSSNNTAKQLAQTLNSIGQENIFNINSNEYRRIGKTEQIVKTTVYNVEEAGTDKFGILCGTLAENATISRVYIKGSELEVLQKADTISAKTTQEGERNKYFYYMSEVNDMEEDDSANIQSSAVVGDELSVYDSSETVTGNGGDANVDIFVEAPKYVEKNGSLVFSVTVTNNRTSNITIKSLYDGTLSGDWAPGEGTVIGAGAQKEFTYTISNVTTDVTAALGLSYSYMNKDVSGNDLDECTPIDLSVSSVTCEVVDTAAAAIEVTGGSGLELKLTPGQINYLTSGTVSVDFTLIMKNIIIPQQGEETVLTIEPDDIRLQLGAVAQAIVWKQDGTAFTGVDLSSVDGAIILTGTMTMPCNEGTYEPQLTVTPSARKKVFRNVRVYTYVSNITGTDLELYGTPAYAGTEVEGVADTYAGNHLNAGVFAGISKGSITESKQEMHITGTQDPTNLSPREELLIGGIVGKAVNSAVASDLYLLGTSSYDGEGSSLPTGSVVLSPTAAMPMGRNAWSSYVKFASDGTQSELFDLSWLVKAKAEADFSYVETNNKIDVSYTSAAMTAKTLSYDIAYNARKNITDDTEENIYVTNDGKMDLGNSGFYRLLNIYATDGYYHYSTPVKTLENAAMKYPYAAIITENPYSIENSDVMVTRLTNPLEDVIQVQTDVNVGVQGGLAYYLDNAGGSVPYDGDEETGVANIGEDGKIQLPFDQESVQYQVVLVVDGHIYPVQKTREVTQAERLPLPKMQVNCYNYYNASSVKNPYISLVENSTYEAGTDMMFVPVNDEGNEGGYSFRYLFTTDAPQAGKWDSEQRFIGNDTAFMDAALEYTDSAVLPKNLANSDAVYLYVEISKKNFDSQIYYYGPFAVSEAIELNAKLTVNGSVIQGSTVVDGDIVILSGAPENAVIQYMMSDAPTDSYVWKTYDSSGIVMDQNAGCYIYARINLGNNKYSEPNAFVYTLAGLCADIRVTPNTGLSSGGEVAAATITSTTMISLASRTPNAEIFYRVSDASMPISMERVSVITDPAITDGYISDDGYKYFEVNGRWYRTKDTDAERFTQAIILSHDKKEAQLMYLSAIAIADGYEPSNVTEYIYKVEPKQKVFAPEATYETRYMPGGEATEIATVAPGSTVSFYSITPEVQLYYAVGTGTGAPSIPVPSTGVPVEGEYGANYIVRVQARREGMLDSDIITFLYHLAYQESVSAPTATPGTTVDVPTVVIPGNKILLSSTTTGASVFYTTDGSSPQVTEDENGKLKPANAATLLYDPNVGIVMPYEGKGYFAITAVAVKKGLANSAEARFTYAYPSSVLEPYSNVDSGKVELNTLVYLKNLTEDAVIYYNMANGDEIPAEPTFSSSVFSEERPFVITQKTTIKAMAAKDSVKSKVVTFVFEPMKQLEAPKPSIESGSIVSRGTVLDLSVAEGVTVYYTMDGSDPLDSKNAAVMTGNSLILNGEPGGQVTIKAYAVASDMSKSEVITLTYQFTQNLGGVIASVASGSVVANGTKINLLSDITGAEIYFTTDGSSPIDDGEKGTMVVIDGTPGTTFIVKAVAYVNDKPGNIITFSYRIKDIPVAPTASPGECTLTVATRVSLYSDAKQIYYTTDGTEPTKSSSLYVEPILINSTTTIKAIAVSEDGEISDVASFTYRAASRAEAPKADWDDTQVLEPGTKVRLASETSNVKIYYTTDGTEPTLDRLDSLLEYDDDGIEINRSVTIKAVAYKDGMRLSNIATWNYLVETIPAVERKKAEAEKLAEEGLQDTDAKALVRNNHREEVAEETRVFKDEEYRTIVTVPEGKLGAAVEFKALEGDIDSKSISYTKDLFGEDYTILTTYYMWMKAGSTYVQPEGEVEIGIPIPEGYENAALTIVQVESNNKVVALNTTRTAGMLYAKTDSIGKCAVVGPEYVEEATKEIPYLLILEIVAGMTLAGGVGYFIVEIIKKMQRNSKYYPNE